MKREWWSCDGEGHTEAEPKPNLTRRSVLWSAGLGALALLGGRRTALADLTFRDQKSGPSGDTLVVVFLRGGADGLNMVIPYGEDAYYKARPSLSIAPPNKGVRQSEKALDLDGFFGLHPSLRPLLPLYKDGKMAIVHAIGSGDQTRSHFEAMSAMERGLAKVGPGAVSGWLARHLNATPGPTSPLRAVAFSSTMPDALRGGTNAIALSSLEQYRLDVSEGRSGFERGLAALYSEAKDEIAEAGRDTLSVLKTLERLDLAAYRPGNNASYPQTELGEGLRQVAFLVKAGVGLEVACLDVGGWDTHVAQGGTTGWLAGSLSEVATSLKAFTDDLGDLSRVSVVVMTEFGRRVAENSGLGTDHGRAGVMMLLGGGTLGGRVAGQWPGLSEESLDGPGDLRVTTDYRSVLAEVLAKRMGNRSLDAVFPNYQPRFAGLVS